MSYLAIEKRLGRVLVHGGLWTNANLPRMHLMCDGDWVSVGASYGTDGCDPVLAIDVDLSGTRAGRVLSSSYWWIQECRARRRAVGS